MSPHENGRPAERIEFTRAGETATLLEADDAHHHDAAGELAELNEEMRRLRARMRRVMGGAIQIETKEE